MHQPGCLIGFLQYIALVSAAQAGFGEAQIKATVTAKSCPGQGRKHYIWYGLTLDRARLNIQCSTCMQNEWGSDEGGEKRESKVSLIQLKGKGNQCGAEVVPQFERPIPISGVMLGLRSIWRAADIRG
jgi:hypothetical protein